MIIAPDGYVLINSHVVHNAASIRVGVNGRPAGTVDDVHRMLVAWPLGESLTVTVLRGAARFDLAMIPAETP